MKRIAKPRLETATLLHPAEMNNIHFGGNHTPLTPKELLGAGCEAPKAEGGSPTGGVK